MENEETEILISGLKSEIAQKDRRIRILEKRLRNSLRQRDELQKALEEGTVEVAIVSESDFSNIFRDS